MARAILFKLGQAIFSLFILLTIAFGLVRLTGDPVYFILPPEATQQQRAEVRARLGLDQPVPVQFAIYVAGVLQGDLGVSYSRLTRDTPVIEMIARRLPATVTMGGAALLLTVLIGVPLGVYSAYWREGRVDRVTRFGAAIGLSVPNFWLGFLTILVFAVHLKVLPAGGYGKLENLILPAAVLSVHNIAGLVRLLRSSMIEVLNSDYVTFLRIKGLPERVILWKHALRNAGLTTLSYMGLVIAGLFTGSVLVESVFVWPGIGKLLVDAIGYRDFNLIQGLVVVFGAIYIGMNLIIDVLYTVLNPRLRTAGQ